MHSRSWPIKTTALCRAIRRKVQPRRPLTFRPKVNFKSSRVHGLAHFRVLTTLYPIEYVAVHDTGLGRPKSNQAHGLAGCRTKLPHIQSSASYDVKLRHLTCNPGLAGSQDRPFQIQSSTTFPEFPERIMSNPVWNSSFTNSWVSTGARSSPPCNSEVILYQVSNISRP